MSEPEWFIRDTLGIQAINGPTWEADLATICEQATDKVCEAYTLMTGREAFS